MPKPSASATAMGRRAWLAATLLLLALAACGAPSGSPTRADESATLGSGSLQIVAAENFWGSIAYQVGGTHVQVTSIIANPDADPHSYEPTPKDARTIVRAKYVIVNGAGYDTWATKLVSANPASGRVVLTVADLFGKKEGDNPHMWYSPDYVGQLIDRVASDLKQIDAANATDYDQQATQYKTDGLKAYHDTIATIKQKYAGTPVGASESIFAYLSPALGLNLITPYAYLKAVSEGTDISPADKAAVQQQISGKQIKVYVYNSQNSTPDVQQSLNQAKAQGIPVTSITETLAPAGATFQDWQTRQLQGILQALGG